MFYKVEVGCYVVYLDTLFSIGKIRFNKLEGVPTYAIVIQFMEENTVIYCVESFGKIEKQTAGNFFFFECGEDRVLNVDMCVFC